jgi:hypothetical protein
MPRKHLAALALLTATAAAQAATITLDFEGLAAHGSAANGIELGDVYNGGTLANGASGANLGVKFSTGAQLLCLNTLSTTCSNASRGGQGNASSQLFGMAFTGGSPVLSIASGFDTGFSFMYAKPVATAITVQVFADEFGGGAMLASYLLPTTTFQGCPGYGSLHGSLTNSPDYCPFEQASVAFAGVAKSVRFSGQANYSVFDDFTFGSTQVPNDVPEPASWALVGAALLGWAGTRRRRG